MIVPRFTFVIPVLNEASNLEVTLKYLRLAFPNSEIIVVDGGSDDCTSEVAREYSDLYLNTSPGRASQMNKGAYSAQGEHLVFLHADTVPSFTESDLDKELLTSTLWGFCEIRLSKEHFIYKSIAWFINRRSLMTSVASGDQMLFVRRAVFLAIGGYDEIPLMEDISLSKRLRLMSKPKVVPRNVVSSSRRWEKKGVGRTIVLMWVLRLAYFFGIAPSFLRRFYHS